MARPRWKRLTIAAVKSLVAVVVLWAVGRHVLRTWNDLGDRRSALRFDPLWLTGSGILYLVGLSAYGRFFERILHAGAGAGRAAPGAAGLPGESSGEVRAGQGDGGGDEGGDGGPIRCAGLDRGDRDILRDAGDDGGGRTGRGGGVCHGGRVGSRPSRLADPGDRWTSRSTASPRWPGLGLGLAFLVVVLPRVFGRIAGLVSSPIPGVGPEALPRLSGRLLVQGVLWSTAGWVLLGLSQLAVVRAFDPDGARALVELGLVPVVIASVALATVAGFVVAVLPGGLGVREGVLMSALAPALGSDRSVVAALMLRLVWVVAELAAALVLVPRFRRRREPVQDFSGSRSELVMISVVVPVHNEEESLTALHGELAAVFADGAHGPAEFLFVDDGSRDGSWRVLTELARNDPRVGAIRFRRNFGKAAALMAGFQAARGEVVFTLDGDLQDDPAEIPRFLAELDRGYDVISGWKKTRHDPWHKVYPSRVFNWMVSHLTGCHLHDHNCGFKLYRRAVLDEVGIYGELHRFIPVLAHARGFRVGEVVVQHRPRRHGTSKYGVSRLVKGFLDLLTVRFLTRFSQRPLHVLGGIGLALLGIGGLGMLYLAIVWLDPHHEPIGTRPLLFYSGAFVSVGMQLLSLGILAELVTAYNIRPEDTYSVR